MTTTGEPPAWHLRWGQPEPYTDDDPNDPDRVGRGHRFEAHVAAHDPAGAGERWATSKRTVGVGWLSRRPDIISVCPDGSLEIGECKIKRARVSPYEVRQAAEGRDAAAEALGPGKVNETAVLHWRCRPPTEKTVTEAAALNVHLVCWISDTDRADLDREQQAKQKQNREQKLKRKRERWAAMSDEEKAERARREQERRANWTPEQAEAKRERDRERQRERRANWTPEQAEAERERDRERQRQRYAKNGRRTRPRRGKPGPGQGSLGV